VNLALAAPHLRSLVDASPGFAPPEFSRRAHHQRRRYRHQRCLSSAATQTSRNSSAASRFRTSTGSILGCLRPGKFGSSAPV